MNRFVLLHRHAPEECGPAYAAWKGLDSPLRRMPVLTSCGNGTHGTHVQFWTVEAAEANEALAQLPRFVANRTEVFEVQEVQVP